MKIVKIVAIILTLVQTIHSAIVHYHAFYKTLFSTWFTSRLIKIPIHDQIESILGIIGTVFFLGLLIVILASRNLLLKDKAYRVLRFMVVINFLLYLPFSVRFFLPGSFFFKMDLVSQIITVTGILISLFCTIVFLMVKPEKQVQRVNLDNYELVTLTSTRHRFVHHLLDLLFLLPGWLALMDLNESQKPGPGTGVLVFAILLGYYFLSEAIFGQTFGKLFTNSCVAGNGVDVSAGRIFLRTLSRLIPFDKLSFLFRGNWHDRLSSTSVVYIDSWQRVFDEPSADKL